jgi:hypothetical protein
MSLSGGVINEPCAAWQRDFCERAKEGSVRDILSLSYDCTTSMLGRLEAAGSRTGPPAADRVVAPSTLLSQAQ